jgi:hypothetical protein
MPSLVRFHRWATAVGLLLCAVTQLRCAQDAISRLTPELLFDCPADGNVIGLPPTGATCAVLDFGDVTLGSSAILKIRLANAGRAALRITDGQLATDLGHVLVVSDPPMGLASNEVQALTVTFTPAALGAVTDTYVLDTSDAKAAHVAIAIKGNGVGHPVLSLSAQTLDFGDVLKGTSSTQNLTLTNTGNVALVVTGLITPAASAFALELPGNTVIQPGQNVTALLTFTPTVPGEVGGTLKLSSDAFVGGVAAGTDQATVMVPLTGRSNPVLDAQPTMVDFGMLSWNSTNTQTVTIHNAGKGDLSITGIVLKMGSSTAYTVTADPGATTAPIAPGASATKAINPDYSPPGRARVLLVL